MTQYQLALEIKAVDLVTIRRADESIIVAKASGSGTPSAKWLTVLPYEHNVVTWTEDYGIYAQNTSGEVTVTSTQYPAQPGACYPFTAEQGFGAPSTCLVEIAPAEYGAINGVDFPGSLTFGLVQAAFANGTTIDPAPVTAELIPANQQGVFSPMLDVWVWLESPADSAAEQAVVPDQAISRPAIVRFGPGTTQQSLVYDSSEGKFVPAT